ncbi:hypothetical protein Hanom_Chr13g01192731 [Helianthus anomalus]
MPIVWRVLYTLENIIKQEGINIGMSELSQLYNLVSHGSHCFLHKHKPGQAHPILKTTKNDSNGRNQFFFVRKDSSLDGNHLPKKWVTRVGIQESPVTQERIAAFWRLDPATRTLQAKVKDSLEISSGSDTISSKYPNFYVNKCLNQYKIPQKGAVTGIQEYASPRSLKKELATSQSIPETKGVSTRGKGTKRKKTAEPLEGLPLMEHQVQEYVSELLVAEMTAQRERIEVMEGAKHSAAFVKLKIKLYMAKEAADPAFDRSGWDVEAWKQRLVELWDEDEP